MVNAVFCTFTSNMSKSLQSTDTGFELHPDNPFKEDWNRMLKMAKTSTRSSTVVEGITTERMTIVLEKQYLPIGFTKLYQNKSLLGDLSPNACKILVHLAVHMQYEQQLVKLSSRDTGLKRVAFSKGITELLLSNILRKQKREWYWINITLLVVGRVKQIEQG